MRVAIEKNFINIYKDINDNNMTNLLVKEFITEYIEKFIQIPFFIPNPDSKGIDEYLESICETSDEKECLENEYKINEPVFNSNNNIQNQNENNNNIYSDSEVKIQFTRNEFNFFKSIITKYVKVNARKYKKLRNLILLNKQIYFSGNEMKASFIDYMTWFIFHCIYTNEANYLLIHSQKYLLLKPKDRIIDIFDFNGLYCSPKDKSYEDSRYELQMNANLYIKSEAFKGLTIDKVVEFSKLSTAFVYPNYLEIM
ncbi:hypothetical protein UF75_5261 [Desulfosporosinus sp. I2]|nr:hypothetical protein UF75_5261 [Desulfosporosinus sp. I2]